VGGAGIRMRVDALHLPIVQVNSNLDHGRYVGYQMISILMLTVSIEVRRGTFVLSGVLCPFSLDACAPFVQL